MAEPVLLISTDPFLGANLEAAAHGRVQVAHLDPAQRPPTWPAGPSTTVVLDVTAHHRDSIHTWIRHHHSGPLVILLKPGERHPALPPDRSRVVVARPFRLIDLVALLEQRSHPTRSRQRSRRVLHRTRRLRTQGKSLRASTNPTRLTAGHRGRASTNPTRLTAGPHSGG